MSRSRLNKEQLSEIVLSGFKSIQQCQITFRKMNVLIGPNGAGKSNLISFFKMVQQMLLGNLQPYVGKAGGPDALLHFGRKKTEKICAEIYFGNNGYKFILEPTQDNRMIFAEESLWWNMGGGHDFPLGVGHFEAKVAIEGPKIQPEISKYVLSAMKSWRVYHFHDTSETARVKQIHGINDNTYLREDACNLAAFLYLLQKQHLIYYERIVKTIKLVAPFFGDFCLRPYSHNQDQIQLEWFEGDEDIPFKAHSLSDGSLRFICLVTLLMQPEEYKPEVILIDEPELGLHPYAIKLLASLFQSASESKQLIISTQSVELLNEFDLEDVIISDRKQGHTYLNRRKVEELKDWLKEYSLGELWQKNLLGGRPSR